MTDMPEAQHSVAVVIWKKFHFICGPWISVARELMLPHDAVVREHCTPEINPPRYFFDQNHGVYVQRMQKYKMIYCPALGEKDERTASILLVSWFDTDASVSRERLVFRRSHDLPMPWIVAARADEKAVFGFCADGETQKKDNRFLQLKFWSEEECARDRREPFLPVFFKIKELNVRSIYGGNTAYFRVSAKRVENENDGHDVFVYSELLDSAFRDIPKHLLDAKPS